MHSWGFIFCLFGSHRLSHLRQYWSSDVDITVPVVTRTMQEDSFFYILGNLYVNDNNAVPKGNSDKHYKIRPLIWDLNRNFQMIRLPHAVQCIDESMVLFEGRSALKQYNPNVVIKYG